MKTMRGAWTVRLLVLMAAVLTHLPRCLWLPLIRPTRAVNNYLYQIERTWRADPRRTLAYGGGMAAVALLAAAGPLGALALPVGLAYTNFPNGVSSHGIPAEAGGLGLFSPFGDVYFGDSGHTSASDDGQATRPDRPAATLDGAIGKTAADQGDVIVLAAGHSETALATKIDLDVAGVTVIGLGIGTTRPQFTAHADLDDDVIDMSAARTRVIGLRFNEGGATPTAAINMDAADQLVEACQFDEGANDQESITLTANAEQATIRRCKFYVTADGPDSAIEVQGIIADLLIEENEFYGSEGTNAYDAACIDFGTIALTDAVVRRNRFDGRGIATTAVNESGAVRKVVVDNEYVAGVTNADNQGYSGLRTLTGTTDVDVSVGAYDAVGGAALLTIEPAAGGPLRDVTVHLDLLKATTGLLVVNTTETVQLLVQRKVDGTNWRTVQHWPAASSTTGIAVPDAAGDLDALDDSPAHTFRIGDVDPGEDVRITLELDAETGGDAEIPYRITYNGPTPTVTAVAAG